MNSITTPPMTNMTDADLRPGQQEWRYERSLGIRRFLLRMSIVWLLCAAGGAYDLLTGFSILRQPNPLVNLGFDLFGILCGGGLLVWFLWEAGPYAFHIDFRERTYELLQGFPLLAKLRKGTFPEMSGISFRKYTSKGGDETWTVYLHWRVSGRPKAPLSSRPSEKYARQQAELWARQLDVPVLSK